jgi:ABC-type multidrug transport system fused ATPase/permease subunit
VVVLKVNSVSSKIMEFLEVRECVGKNCIEDDARPAPAGWPADGAIEMKDIYFDYRTGAPCALNGVSVSVKSGEKIGVCGRTGAGKSRRGRVCHQVPISTERAQIRS